MKKWLLLLLGAVICTECVFAENIKITNDSDRTITIKAIYATNDDFNDLTEKLASSRDAKKLKCPELPLTLRVDQSKSLSVESPDGYEEGFGIVFTYTKGGKKITCEECESVDEDEDCVEFEIDECSFDDDL